MEQKQVSKGKKQIIHRAYILKVDGTTVEFNHQPTLIEAQTAVGGYVELMPKCYQQNKSQTIFVNEEGLMNTDCYLNQLASDLLIVPQVVVGDAIVLEGWRTLK